MNNKFNLSISKIAIALTIVTLIPSGNALSQENQAIKIITVVGSGPIYGENISNAKDRAIGNSLIFAVSLAVEEILSPDLMLQRFDVLNKTLFTDTEKFIREFKVLTESISKNRYSVLVRATIAMNSIRKHLLLAGIEPGKGIMPKVLFLVSEQNLETIFPLYWWGEESVFVAAQAEKSLAEEMRKKEFTIIDHVAMVQNQELEPLNQDMELNDDAAVALGGRFEADVVIVGNAVTRKLPNLLGSTVQSFEGAITARAIRTDTTEEIASTTQSITSTSTDEMSGSHDALNRAAKLAGEKLATQIGAAWSKAETGPNLIEIRVEGTSYLANLVKFRKVINELPGISNITIKEIQPDQTTLNANFQGNAKALAKTLMLMTFDGFGIKIDNVSDNRLTVELNSN